MPDGGRMSISRARAGAEAIDKHEAMFLDASGDGSDVFFITRAQLLLQDHNHYFDVYDARAGGGLPAPVTQVPCQGSACQGPPTQPPLLSAPISSSFLGSGNLPAPHPVARLTRKQLLSRALATCRKLKSRRKRAACVAAANRRYASSDKRAGRGVAKRRSRE